jgi:uncharacterized protein (TIGR01244 family)
MKIRTLGLAFALAALAAVARAAEIPGTFDALNYQKLSPALAVAGKPSNEAFAKLKEAGFRTAIDLRQPAEGVALAREAIEAQGLTFVSVPVSPETFSLGDAKKVAAVLDDPKAGPVLLYCSSSNRVGGVLATLDALKGKPLEEALAAGRKAGLKSPAMEKAVVRVVETRR